jgi:hypothetical protein
VFGIMVNTYGSVVFPNSFSVCRNFCKTSEVSCETLFIGPIYHILETYPEGRAWKVVKTALDEEENI